MSTPDTGPSAVKAEARRDARARRREASAPDADLIARQCRAFLDTIHGPRRVASYASYGTEPGTAPLNTALAEAGFEVLVPRVRGDDLEWADALTPAAISSMGIAEPTGQAVPLLPVRALLVPALRVTPDGDRLGKGGGFYDRLLAGLGPARPVVAAIVGDGDVVPSLPTQEHDQRVDVIITPTRTLHCRVT